MAHNSWIFTFGILGNIISIMMYLAPLPTFFRVYRKKSTEGFQSIPYIIALFNSMVWIYYATLKSNDYLLLIINSVGCLVECIYIIIFIVYAPKKARILTLKLVILSNFVGFFSIFVLTHFFAQGSNRLHIVGWFCVALSAAVFAAPLSIMRLVIRTKSVEFMPSILSFSLTLSGIMWFLYGILLRDFYIALPNILGVILGMIQMVLYAIYKDCNKINKEQSLPGHLNSNTIKSFEVNDTVPSLPTCDDVEVVKEEKPNVQRKPNEDCIEAPSNV